MPEGRRLRIDREGGFGEENLEQRVRELWVRLAQMEAEKLRAVEEAVEEERRIGTDALQKERIILERDKYELAKEKEQMRREREAMDLKMRSINESQTREADMVNKLQAKLVKYRQEALEGGELMEQLTSQAKSDQQIIRDLQEYAEAGQQELTTVKVL